MPDYGALSNSLNFSRAPLLKRNESELKVQTGAGNIGGCLPAVMNRKGRARDAIGDLETGSTVMTEVIV